MSRLHGGTDVPSFMLDGSHLGEPRQMMRNDAGVILSTFYYLLLEQALATLLSMTLIQVRLVRLTIIKD